MNALIQALRKSHATSNYLKNCACCGVALGVAAEVISHLASPKRFACLLLRLFLSNSNVLELAIIHLQQLSPLAEALTA